MAVYQVRLVNPEIALDRTITVPDDEYILDIVEAIGIRLPAGCRQGTCSAYIAKLVSGEGMSCKKLPSLKSKLSISIS